MKNTLTALLDNGFIKLFPFERRCFLNWAGRTTTP
ncbi:MAG: hypothetical protein RIR18_43 [Pseudomonadota bacterium]